MCLHIEQHPGHAVFVVLRVGADRDSGKVETGHGMLKGGDAGDDRVQAPMAAEKSKMS